MDLPLISVLFAALVVRLASVFPSDIDGGTAVPVDRFATEVRAPADLREPPENSIDSEVYGLNLAEIKTLPDPPRLAINGTTSRGCGATISKMIELPEGKVDPDRAGDCALEVLGDDETVLYSITYGSQERFEDSSSAPGLQPTDTVGMAVRVAYPSLAATVRFRRGETVLLAVDPLSMTLRFAFESIPDRGFVQTPSERRQTLLAKVDVLRAALDAGHRTGALETLRNEIRPAAEAWIVDYTGKALELSRVKVLAQIDSVESRLLARLEAFPPSPTPTPIPLATRKLVIDRPTKPKGNSISCGYRDDLVVQQKPPGDPGILDISGTVTSAGLVEISRVREVPDGMIVRAKSPPGWTIDVLDADGYVIVSVPWSVDFRNPAPGTPGTISMIGRRILYPIGAARVQFKHGDDVWHEFDPLSRTLRDAVQEIADRGFDQNPAQRRAALLSEVDAFETRISAGDRRGALQRLPDIRGKVDTWVVDYRADLLETSKPELTRLLDSLAARLRHQIGGEPIVTRKLVLDRDPAEGRIEWKADLGAASADPTGLPVLVRFESGRAVVYATALGPFEKRKDGSFHYDSEPGWSPRLKVKIKSGPDGWTFDFDAKKLPVLTVADPTKAKVTLVVGAREGTETVPLTAHGDRLEYESKTKK